LQFPDTLTKNARYTTARALSIRIGIWGTAPKEVRPLTVLRQEAAPQLHSKDAMASAQKVA